MVSVIIPAYNEENRIGKTLEKLKGENVDEIIVVCDGNDNTVEIAKKHNVKVLEFDKRLGKGKAIKKGLKEAQKDIVAFTDADYGFQNANIKDLVKHLDESDIAIGVRKIKEIKKPHRKIISKGLRLFTKSLIGLNFQDTQCGFKAFKKDVFEDIIQNVESGGYSFDIELLNVAKDKYEIREVPVSWNVTEHSKVNPFLDSLDVFFKLWKIKWKQKK